LEFLEGTRQLKAFFIYNRDLVFGIPGFFITDEGVKIFHAEGIEHGVKNIEVVYKDEFKF